MVQRWDPAHFTYEDGKVRRAPRLIANPVRESLQLGAAALSGSRVTSRGLKQKAEFQTNAAENTSSCQLRSLRVPISAPQLVLKGHELLQRINEDVLSRHSEERGQSCSCRPRPGFRKTSCRRCWMS